MKTAKFLLIAGMLLSVLSCGQQTTLPLTTPIPARPAGATDVLGLRCDPIDTVRVGVIGLGMRGSDVPKRFVHIPGTRITALCDILEENVASSAKVVTDAGFPEPACFSGSEDAWKQLCEREDVDLVYICTDWVHHTPMALYAMEHGKHAAIEVPAATTLEECWALVNTSERTRKHCMMLENCVYDFFELTALQMAREGLFGEIIHVEGAYNHNLDPFWGRYWNNWRLAFNQQHRGDVYPTHGLGPICQVLDIHRSDRMESLVAYDTTPINGPKHAAAAGMEGDFANGDLTCTLIRTEKGKTILVEHDVMTPRPYSRMYQLVGTDGYAAKYPVQQLCFREEGAENVDYQNLGKEIKLTGEALEPILAQHRSPILTEELETLAKEVGGHGGMDFIMDYRLVYCLRNGLPLDMDVYDLAEWCCISELSAISCEHGGAPVAVPDFTRGSWKK